jgi:hypothetical protein
MAETYFCRILVSRFVTSNMIPSSNPELDEKLFVMFYEYSSTSR